MTKPIFYCSVISVLAVLTTAILVNYQSSSFPTKKANFSTLQLQKSTQSDWENTLSGLKQFAQKKTAKEDSETTLVTPTLDDSQIIGIMLGKTKSILLQPKKSTTPITLRIGESWLSNWNLKEINADSVVWENIQNNENYTQMLFSSVSENDK